MTTGNSFFATIYSDASFNHETGHAAYSFYIKCSKGKVEDSASVEGVQDVNHAEMFAIYKGVEAALHKWPELEGVFVNTDSLVCCHILWPFRNTKDDHKSRRAVDTASLITKILGDKWMRTKHVKAHTGGSDIRSKVNRLVDRKAKKAFRSTQ